MFENTVLNKQVDLSLEPIQKLLDCEEITDIYIDDFDQITIKKSNGKIYKSGLNFESIDHLKNAADLLSRQRGLELGIENPYLDTVTRQGQRVNIVISPIYSKDVCLTIRKFPKKKFGKEDLILFKTIDERGFELLEILVSLGKRILIAGETGSGKTTLLNILCSFIDPSRGRLITIEDARELQFDHPYLISLQTSYSTPNALPDTSRNKSFNDILINSLRMDPVWTVLGEIRGNEALTLIESFISHPGMATIHAKSCHAALIKLKMKIGESVNIRPEIIDQMITNAVDIVIFIKQIHNTKRVMEIAEVLAAPAVDSQYRLNTLLKFKSSQDGETFSILNKPTFLAELEDIGISMPEFWR